MSNEKRGRQKCPAYFIITAEIMFRRQKDCGAKGEADRKADLLPQPTAPPKQRNDGRQCDKRSETKTRFDRSEKDRGEGEGDAVCNRGGTPVLQKKTGDKLDQKIKSNAKNKRADALGPNFFLENNSLPGQKEDGEPTQSQQIMTNATDLW